MEAGNQKPETRKAAASRTAACAGASAPSVPARSPSSPSWVETFIARRNAARGFLAGKGRTPYRSATDGPSRWHVAGWTGTFDDHDLMKLAEHYGWRE
jgi:hypothetical protein